MSLYDRAAIIPGRSATCSKAPDRLLKAWAAGAQGAIIWDTEGREYIDMLCALGAISLGYPPHRVNPKLYGGVYSLPHCVEIEAGEAVLKHVAPWASSVRFLKTGSESVHCAYRVAKAETERSDVLVGDWAYHGWHEWCRPAMHTYPNGFDFRESLGRGWYHAGLSPIVTLDEIAAVFIEPARFQHVDADWLKSVRLFCDRIGALLVFDSMIYGGRHAFGGTSDYFGVQPDMECFGKAMANGEACAFVVGRDALATHGEIASGTYSGCATGLQAVVDTLHTYTTEPVIDTLWARGRQLADGLEQMLADYPGLAVREGQPVHQRVRFLDNHDVKGKQLTDEMAKRGVLWHKDVVNVMYAHTPAQIDRVIGAFAESLKVIA